MSSMDQEIMKSLLKILTQGVAQLTPDVRDRLVKYSQTILDKDR
jgi:hypothetical protein